jgi:hypothetical protein
MGQDARLAAACSGQDQYRAVRGLDGALLLGIEAGQDSSGQGFGGGLPFGQGHRLGLERRRLARFEAWAVE